MEWVKARLNESVRKAEFLGACTEGSSPLVAANSPVGSGVLRRF